MNGKIFIAKNGSVFIKDNDSPLCFSLSGNEKFLDMTFVDDSDIVYDTDIYGNVTNINECVTSAEIHNIGVGWVCPRCNRVNAPFVTNCDC